jgi:redox-sensitive bicupin YhaK (pirin superfamily)
VGVDAALRSGSSEWPLRPDFEHALLVLQGSVSVDGRRVGSDNLAYLGLGRSQLTLVAETDARLLLLGGEPFAESILMWWNFVARTRAEVEDATRQWNAAEARFGRVASPLERIPAPPVPQGLSGH